MAPIHALALATSLTSLLSSSGAIAAPPPSAPAEPPAAAAVPARDTTQPRESARGHFDVAPRPWLYAPDPTAPAPGHVFFSMGVGYAQVDRGAAAPFAADVAHAGAVFSGSAEVGLHRYVSVHAEGMLSEQLGGSGVSAGAMIGASAFPLGGKGPVDVAISGGYLRELAGANGVWARGGIAGDIGHVRLSMTGLAAHIFEKDRDEADILVTTGVSYSFLPFLRAGAEYVVQDLEGAWDPEEADGGIRHFAGANVAFLLGNRVQIAAGPAVGLSAASPRVLGRLAATYAF